MKKKKVYVQEIKKVLQKYLLIPRTVQRTEISVLYGRKDKFIFITGKGLLW